MQADYATDDWSELILSFDFDEGKLPSLPRAVTYLENAMQDDNVSLQKLSELLSTDPVLAARLVRVANSPFYRAINSVETVPDAVNRIGFTATRNIALVLLQNSFRAKNKIVASTIRELWVQSVSIAAIASVMSRHFPLVDGSRAMFGGLMYNVGAMLLLTNLDGYLKDIDISISLHTLVDQHAPLFGVRLLEHWELDPELIDVVANREYFTRETQSSPDLADLILVARSCVTDSLGNSPDFELCESLPCYKRVQGVMRQPTPLASVVEDAHSAIARTLDMLT